MHVFIGEIKALKPHKTIKNAYKWYLTHICGPVDNFICPLQIGCDFLYVQRTEKYFL